MEKERKGGGQPKTGVLNSKREGKTFSLKTSPWGKKTLGEGAVRGGSNYGKSTLGSLLPRTGVKNKKKPKKNKKKKGGGKLGTIRKTTPECTRDKNKTVMNETRGEVYLKKIDQKETTFMWGPARRPLEKKKGKEKLHERALKRPKTTNLE